MGAGGGSSGLKSQTAQPGWGRSIQAPHASASLTHTGILPGAGRQLYGVAALGGRCQQRPAFCGVAG